MRRAAIAVLALAALVALVPASGAQERSHTVEFSVFKFGLRASNGYQARVVAYSFGRGEEVATVALTKGGAAVAYSRERGVRIRNGRLRASFRGLGRIAVRFEPSSGDLTGDECRSEEGGTFRGTIRIRGERGFAVARARKARGRVTVRRYGDCERERVQASVGLDPIDNALVGIGIGGGGARGRLVLYSCGPVEDTSYAALLGPRGATHVAYTSERRRGLYIARSATARGPRDTVRIAKDESGATVTPPGNFSGVGRFAPPDLLAGDLRVSLPGLTNPLDLTPGTATLDGRNLPRCRG